ncbi:MAG: hypothetical protein R3299_00625 [Arenibacter sp.]|nr:hypothetical protein [Arenibacter sp.]
MRKPHIFKTATAKYANTSGLGMLEFTVIHSKNSHIIRNHLTAILDLAWERQTTKNLGQHPSAFPNS